MLEDAFEVAAGVDNFTTRAVPFAFPTARHARKKFGLAKDGETVTAHVRDHDVVARTEKSMGRKDREIGLQLSERKSTLLRIKICLEGVDEPRVNAAATQAEITAIKLPGNTTIARAMMVNDSHGMGATVHAEQTMGTGSQSQIYFRDRNLGSFFGSSPGQLF